MLNINMAVSILAVVLTGCAAHPSTVHVIPQNDAPVQIISIAPHGDNLLGHMVVKNTTDKPVLNFNISWVIIIPKDCSSDRRGQAIRLLQASQSAYAEQRGTRMLGPGEFWGSRPLKPHEQTEQITMLPTITRESLAKMAKADGARRIRVQVWIGSVDYAPPEALNGSAFTHIGPDWREEKFAGYIPDAADAEGQACTGA